MALTTEVVGPLRIPKQPYNRMFYRSVVRRIYLYPGHSVNRRFCSAPACRVDYGPTCRCRFQVNEPESLGSAELIRATHHDEDVAGCKQVRQLLVVQTASEDHPVRHAKLRRQLSQP